MEVPETPRDFLKTMGERSLRHDFRVVYNIDPPDYLMTEGQFRRAGEEWRERYKEALAWLGIASKRALAYLPDNLPGANMSFISDVESIPELRQLFNGSRQVYLSELMAACHANVGRLTKLLGLFVELAK